MTPLARNMAFTLLALFVIGGAATRILGGAAPPPDAGQEVRDQVAAMMADDVQDLGGDLSPFGLTADGAARHVRRGLRVVDEINGVPIVAVPEYLGVGLDRVNVRAWLMTYGNALPRGEAHHRLGMLYEFGLFETDRDPAAALWWYESAERDTHGGAHRRAATLRSQGVQPRPSQDQR